MTEEAGYDDLCDVGSVGASAAAHSHHQEDSGANGEVRELIDRGRCCDSGGDFHEG